MNKTIITSTTDSVEGGIIEKYFEIISVNVVVGTNVFSDFGATFTDMLGGLSSSYQNKLESIYKVGIDKLKSKASQIGANAILGIRIDFDEISGKGKSMFMVSVQGTAVKVRYNEERKEISQSTSEAFIAQDVLEREITKRLIILKIGKDIVPSEDDWGYLMNFPIPEISEKLLNMYLVEWPNRQHSYGDAKFLSIHIQHYFTIIGREYSEKLLYQKLEENVVPIINLLSSCNLFSRNELIKLLKSDKVQLAIKCLGINKNYYSNADLQLMREIIALFDNLRDLGRIENVKSVLGKEKEKYICPEGHRNDAGIEYCKEVNCGKSIKGLTRDDIGKVKQFKIKVESLETILATDE